MSDEKFDGIVTIGALGNASKVSITLDGNSGDIAAGGGGQLGSVAIKNLANKEIVLLGSTFEIQPGLPQQSPNILGSGLIVLRDDFGAERLSLHGKTGHASISGLVTAHSVAARDVAATNSKGTETIRLDGDSGGIEAGGNGQLGSVAIKNLANKEIVRLGTSFEAVPGLAQQPPNTLGSGLLALKDDFGVERLSLHGKSGNATIAGVVTATGVVARNLYARNNEGTHTIRMDGESGDIVLLNGDCAEEFDVSNEDDVSPGTVVVIDTDGRLRPSAAPYDRRVAGVVSGAGDLRPGIVLGKKHSQEIRKPLALVGRVSCKVDAEGYPIEIGDLLTTSSTPGYAMKADDPLKAFGAVIGKALQPLARGRGMISILVALQ